MEEREDEEKSRLGAAHNTLLLPLRVAISKPARRAYLTSFLVVSTATVLLGFAVTAYALFYWSYVPRVGFERTVHLQFDSVYSPSDNRHGSATSTSPYPYGMVSLTPDIVSAQAYDIMVELSLPTTPENRDTGNFMLEATLHAPHQRGSGIVDKVTEGLHSTTTASETVLARSRRPAIMTYHSPIVEQIFKLTELHWYLLGWRHESEVLRVDMFESVEFAKGWRNIPTMLKLEVQSTHRMQIYSARVAFHARFKGLRWLMYNYQTVSAFVFIGGFWTTEMIFAALAWMVLTVFVFPQQQDVKQEDTDEDSAVISKEDDTTALGNLSDTERTFPTRTGRPLLRYSSPAIKKEEDEEKLGIVPELTPRAHEADDEDEDADFFLDSGLGTSMESSASARRDIVRRRRSRMDNGDGR